MEPPDAPGALRLHALARHLGARATCPSPARRRARRSTACSAWSSRGGRARVRGAAGQAPQAVAEGPVVRAVGPHVGGQRRVAARLGAAAGLLERAAQAEVGVVVDRVALDHRGELLARPARSGPSGSRRGRAPRGSSSCRARASRARSSGIAAAMKSPASSSSLPLLEQVVRVLGRSWLCLYGTALGALARSALDLVEDRRGHRLLRAARHVPLAAPR